MPAPRLPVPPRIARIQAALLRLGEICPGSLVRRLTICGKPACRCARDPEARHGPYHIWSRLRGRSLRQTTLAPPQAQRMARAIRNYRRAEALLARWGRETERTILTSRE